MTVMLSHYFDGVDVSEKREMGGGGVTTITGEVCRWIKSTFIERCTDYSPCQGTCVPPLHKTKATKAPWTETFQGSPIFYSPLANAAGAHSTFSCCFLDSTLLRFTVAVDGDQIIGTSPQWRDGGHARVLKQLERVEGADGWTQFLQLRGSEGHAEADRYLCNGGWVGWEEGRAVRWELNLAEAPG